MKEIKKEQLEQLVNFWQNQKKNWHFHILTSDCLFNKNKDKHAFVLENLTDNENYVVYSEKRLMVLGQKFVKMLHGDKILEQTEERVKLESETMKNLVEKIKKLNKNNISWHHHMLFPDCVFNKHRGKWNIFFEDKEDNKNIELLYDYEPVDDLRQIENLYYQQKE